MEKEQEEANLLDDTTLDWWSKYFASMDSLNEVIFKYCCAEFNIDFFVLCGCEKVTKVKKE